MRGVRSIVSLSFVSAVCLIAPLVLTAAPASATTATVTANPPLVSFGAIKVGQVSKPREVAWTNNTTNETINIFNWVLYSAPDFDFYNFEQSTCGQVGAILLPGQSCSFQVIFHPTSTGRIDGLIIFTYYITDPSAPQFVTVRLKGMGT